MALRLDYSAAAENGEILFGFGAALDSLCMWKEISFYFW
jgi:hypothetical protein